MVLEHPACRDRQHYVDFGSDGVSVVYMTPTGRSRRAVKQYVIFGTRPPIQALYSAHNIIVKEGNSFIWLKHRDQEHKIDVALSNDEAKELLIQMLKSEVW